MCGEGRPAHAAVRTRAAAKARCGISGFSYEPFTCGRPTVVRSSSSGLGGALPWAGVQGCLQKFQKSSTARSR